MTPKRFPPDDPREWLRRARSNVAHARAISPEVCLEDLCFDAQQAAEKAVKAVFIHRHERFPYIHELDPLLDRLEQSGLRIPKYIREADDLSPFAAVTRYRGRPGAVTERTYRRAIRLAAAVLRCAERQVGWPGT